MSKLKHSQAEEFELGRHGAMRRPGGGRNLITENQPTLLDELESLVEPFTRGEPESPLRWTTKSTTKLAQTLQAMGYQVSQRTVCRLLQELGYSLQSNRKTKEGKNHPERDAQFQQINRTVQRFQQQNQPVISVDAKKKELIGQYKQTGVEWRPQADPLAVNLHDFADQQLGKVIPYGVYDLSQNQGWVSVGIDHDTAQLAVESIRQWWVQMGQLLDPEATELLISADCGGSNSCRSRLWKWELQQLSTQLGLTLQMKDNIRLGLKLQMSNSVLSTWKEMIFTGTGTTKSCLNQLDICSTYYF